MRCNQGAKKARRLGAEKKATEPGQARLGVSDVDHVFLKKWKDKGGGIRGLKEEPTNPVTPESQILQGC